ncbi:carbonic anhydrase [Coccomyxa subellipsoidea C-169]|uniref:carbonic anhydrase n=1 Tax=Coccomyxa subellipsoidea (strain C-169) TaxID=574566 RepID=I0YLJ8_COCSC|nr:carbonic anhydrase [Coccomyxa subellipsoidea C-169]EIE19267.1 carbonic anhydrase [Coccomyxa subellipsoidea C-169]|eukprot:XP_005643811.1 carbonic anhydrase [Coccomyxa subellipsoidea C-169]
MQRLWRVPFYWGQGGPAQVTLTVTNLLTTLRVQAGSDGNLQIPAAVKANISSGEGLCMETTQSRYGGNGPALPAFNYASSGDDWTGECKTGKQQSPIDLPEKDSSSLGGIPGNHLIRFGSVTATSNAVLRLEIDEVEVLSANWTTKDFLIPVCGGDNIGCLESAPDAPVEYMNASIVNLHFHANSEHTREGALYGAEAHLVTKLMINGQKRLVVFGTWMDVAKNQTNELFKSLQPYINDTNVASVGAVCSAVPDDVVFNIETLFPASKSYYAYRGSLTTPPCTEGVTWIVFTKTVPMSTLQLKSLYKSNAYTSQPCANVTTNSLCNVLGARTNNRMMQPLNDRTIKIGNMGPTPN